MRYGACVFLMIIAASGCGEGPRCGDGKLDPDETETTCCQDTGCARGVCGPAGACVDPWTLACPSTTASGSCSTTQPLVCMGEAMPSYDCATCGCPSGQVCDQAVCQPADLAALKSTELGVSTSLPIEDYFQFVDDGMSPDALTLAELITELDARLGADARRSALLLGESHGSDDEQAVARAVVRGLHGDGWTFGRMGIEGGKDPIFDGKTLADAGVTPFAISGDLTNTAYCTAVKREAGMLSNRDHVYVQYTGSGHTSREACYHPEHYSICNPPHAAECLETTGRKALVVMLFDPAPWLTTTDQALLWRAGNLLPDAAAFDAELAASLAAWERHLGAQLAEPRYDAVADTRMVNMRARVATHADDVFIAYFPRPALPPRLMKTWKAVWDDAGAKAFVMAHQMRPQDCSLGWDTTPGMEMNFINCDKDGATLSATLDGKTYAITELTMM